MKHYPLFLVGMLFGIAILFNLTSCTEQERAKAYGGTANIQVPKGNKLVSATWKDTQLWYLYRPMREGEQPEKSTLHESSSYGIVEGKVVFVESK